MQECCFCHATNLSGVGISTWTTLDGRDCCLGCCREEKTKHENEKESVSTQAWLRAVHVLLDVLPNIRWMAGLETFLVYHSPGVTKGTTT